MIMRWLHQALLGSAEKELAALKVEIAEDRREIAATKPIVEEATKRTNKSFTAVEAQTKRARLECSLVHDIREGFGDNG